ncbi:MAG: hypothetical protein ACLQVK_26320 [Acidimicrobiales bacterium]
MSAAPIATHTFACFTTAAPDRVWAALTATGGKGGYLYGLVARSSWLPGDDIHFQTVTCSPVTPPLTGRVLHAQPPWRLSYFLQAGPEDPPVYLTWQVRSCPSGSTVQLRVDETGGAGTDEEAENAWLPVLAALQALLPRDEYGRQGQDRA